jgi:glycosyltransferase involved in cell wall biosynthesis
MRRLTKAGVSEPLGVEWMGEVPRERWLATVASARLFVNASRHEDWGLAQMEALSAGTPLVTVPSCGANVALPLAAELAPELVAPERTAEALARALRAGLALDEPARKRYAAAAERLLEPYRDEELRRRVADEVLPVLLRG